MVLFKDLHKKSEDLLSRDWVSENSAEVENNWKADNGFSFKNKTTFSAIGLVEGLKGCCASNGSTCCPKSPPTNNTEVSFENDVASVTIKYDSIGKSCSQELKAKNLYLPGLIVSNKFCCRGGYEANLEYQAPKTTCHSSLSINPFACTKSPCGTSCSTGLLFSNVFQPHKQILLGAQVCAPFSNPSSALKFSVGASFNNLEKNGIIGVKVCQDMAAKKVCGQAFLHFSQGNTESTASLKHGFCYASPNSSIFSSSSSCCQLPSLVFCVKQEINPSVWVKASVSDSLAVKGLATWKYSDLVTASMGIGIDQNEKSAKDQVKFGLKLSFQGGSKK